MQNPVLIKEILKIRLMMGLNENQQSINEDGILYLPEKIDEFVVEAKKDIEKGKNMINKFGSILINTSLAEIYDKTDEIISIQDEALKSKKYIGNKSEKFFDVVYLYEIGEYPDNIKILDNLSSELDEQSLALSDIADAFGDLINMLEIIKRNNSFLFKTENTI